MSTSKKPMTLGAALRQWDSTDEAIREEARALILDKIGHRAVIKIDAATGKVDVDETQECLAFAKEHRGNDEQEGCITPATLFAEAKKQTEADPIDGRPLRKGKTATRPVVDWSAVSMDQRKVVAYAAEIGEVRPGDSEDVVDEIQRGPSAQSVAWKRRTREWTELLAKPRKTPQDKILIDRVEARLYAQESPVPFAEAPPVRPAPRPAPQTGGVYVGGNVTGSVVIQGNGNGNDKPCAADGRMSCPGYRGSCGGPGEMGQCGRRIPGAPPFPGSSVPTPADIARPTPQDQAAIDILIAHLVTFLQKDYTPVTTATSLPRLPAHREAVVRPAVVEHFARSGWLVCFKHDQRDGDFITVKSATR